MMQVYIDTASGAVPDRGAARRPAPAVPVRHPRPHQLDRARAAAARRGAQAARARIHPGGAGASACATARIITRHILPNVMHIVLIALVMDFSGLVLAEAVLSYVGVGVDPSMISFGTMINAARLEMAREPMVWWSLAAAFAFMFVLVLAANLFADAVRDAFDPRVPCWRRARAAGRDPGMSAAAAAGSRDSGPGSTRTRRRGRACGRRRRLRDRARRDLRPRRRVRLRQEHDRALADAAAAGAGAHRGRYRAPGRHRAARPLRSAHARRARRAHRHDLPGTGDEPEPGADDRPPDRRGARAARRLARGCGAHAYGGAARCGGDRRRRAADRRVSVPAVRRHEAARDDRDRARGGAGAADRRRADHRARRDDPGPGARTAGAPAARTRHVDPAHHARPRRGCGAWRTASR